jgi:hypothetical protein
LVDSDAADPDAPESAELDPDDPPDPVVSANATGTDATAEPTPNATANAPTRPTNGAKLDDPTSVAVTARRPYSIARTRPPETRRWRPVGCGECAEFIGKSSVSVRGASKPHA